MKKFKYVISIVFSLIVLFLTVALCTLCFLPLFDSFNIFTLLCGIFGSLIPGAFCYGLASALAEFTGHRGRYAAITLLAIILGILILIEFIVKFVS